MLVVVKARRVGQGPARELRGGRDELGEAERGRESRTLVVLL